MNHLGDTNRSQGGQAVSICPKCGASVSMYDTGGNPWYACGSTKTFRSGSCVDREPVWTQLLEAQQRIKRLEEAGDGLMKSINCGCPYGPSVFNCQTCTNSWDAWHKAKEAKP